MNLAESYARWPPVPGGRQHAVRQSGQSMGVPYERKPEAAYTAPATVNLSAPFYCNNIQMKIRRKTCTCLDQQWVLEEAVSVFS